MDRSGKRVRPTTRRPLKPGVELPEIEHPLAEEAEAIIRACEGELAHDPPAERAGRLHYEIARLCESPFGLQSEALEHYRKALAHLPDHLPTIRGGRRMNIALQRYADALELFDAEVRLTPEAELKSALMYMKGRMLEDVVLKREPAREAYRQALELDANNALALKAVEQCDFEDGRWEALGESYEKESNLFEEDPALRAALTARHARILEAHLHDAPRALELYEQAIGHHSGVAGGIAALKRLNHQQKRWSDLVRTLEREADRTTSAEVRAQALYTAAQIHWTRLSQRAEAVDALERAAEATPREPRVLNALARHYEAQARWDALSVTLEKLVATKKHADERVDLLMRLGRVAAEHLDDQDAARRWWETALEIQADHVPVLDALGKLYTRTGDWEALIAMHEAEVEHAATARQRAAAHVRIGDVLEGHVGDPDEAAKHYALALSAEPRHLGAFKALARLHSAAGRWRQLAELYDAAVREEGQEPARAMDLLMRMGAIYEDKLEDHTQAAHCYRRVLALDGEYMNAIVGLQRSAERAGRHKDLVAALEMEAKRLRDVSRVTALLHRAGEVLLDQLEDEQKALGRFRKVLQLDPKHRPTLASLGRLYYHSGRWDDLLEVYRQELALEEVDARAAQLLVKMGEICETRIGKPDDALDYYQQAIARDASHMPALLATERVLRARKDWRALTKVLNAKLALEEDAHAKAAALCELAEIYEDQLGNHKKAVSSYRKALESAPGLRAATEAIQRIQNAEEAWEALVEDLEADAKSAPDPQLATDARLMAGEILWDQLDEPAHALQAFEAVLAAEPEHVAAVLALESLCRKTRSWEALASVHARQAEVFQDPKARVAALHELARLQRVREIGGADDSLMTYDAVLAIAPGDVVALEALEQLAIERGDPTLMMGVSRRLAEMTEDPGAKAARLLRLAESLEIAGDANALAVYQAVVGLDPESVAGARGLARVAERVGDAASAAAAARREAESTADPRRAAALYVKSGLIRADRLAEADAARDDLERALELDPDNAQASERLAALLMAAGDVGRLVDVLGRAAEGSRDDERRAALWKGVARLQADRLDNTGAAIRALQRILERSAQHEQTHWFLAELMQRAGRWQEAADHLEKAVALCEEPAMLVRGHYELAVVHDDKLGNKETALEHVQKVLELEPTHPEGLKRHLDLQAGTGNADEAAATAAQLAQVATDPQEKAGLLVRLGTIERSRGNEANAARAFLEALALEGPGGKAGSEYLTMMGTHGTWREYAGAVDGYLGELREGQAVGPPTPPGAYVELARIKREELEDTPGAIEALEWGIDRYPEARELRVALSRLLIEEGRGNEALTELRILLDQSVEDTWAWRQISQIYAADKQRDEARYALAGLVVLGAADEAEAKAYGERNVRTGMARPGSLGPDSMRMMTRRHDGHLAAAALMAAMNDGLPKLYPPRFDALGLSSRDKITARSGLPIRDFTDRVAAAFGVESYDLYVHETQEPVLTEVGDPPVLVVPSNLLMQPEPERWFLVGRKMALIAQSLHAVGRLSTREVEIMLASAGRLVQPSYGGAITSGQFLDEQGRRLSKALSRRGRRALEEAAEVYVRAPRVDVPAWVQSVERTATRAALILCDDLPASIRAVQQAGIIGDLDTVVADMMHFWISEPGLTLRRNVGLLARGVAAW